MSVISTVLDADGSSLHARFAQAKLSLAVPLADLTTDLPGSTPIVWTRGLQRDGTWSADTPYGRRCGIIGFLDGTLRWYPDLRRSGCQLVRYDGRGLTSDIFAALPPGTPVGEYAPTKSESVLWSIDAPDATPLLWTADRILAAEIYAALLLPALLCWAKAAVLTLGPKTQRTILCHDPTEQQKGTRHETST